jgi:glutamate decarboxylase
VLLSHRHRHLLEGIEVADSVTIDGHKQLYLPIGTGIVCFRDPRYARVIERNAYYIIRPGSNDLGRRALEGSRPSSALYLHAALSIIGRSGYGRIIDENLRLARVMATSVAARPELELLSEPELNIVLFRYVPRHLRRRVDEGSLDAADHEEINRLNSELQEAQWRAGRCFVARTELRHTRYGRSRTVVALRAVLANPATRDEHLEVVLDDILRVASELEGRRARSSVATAPTTAARER